MDLRDLISSPLPMPACQEEAVGLGFKISLPESSHDILKSPRTCLTLETILKIKITFQKVEKLIHSLTTHMAGATTRLWMPIKNSINKTMQLNVKNK